MPTGLIVAAHGRHAVLELDDGRRLQAHSRGKRTEVVVGDRVEWQPTQGSGEDQAVIEAVQPRRNLMFRQDAWRTKSFASNLDQVLVLVAGQPMFSEAQLMRALIAAEAADIETLLVLNKTDLPQAQAARARLAPYPAMGCRMVEVSVRAQPDHALSTLMPLLENRSTLLLGASGTGKSSLLNLVIPQAASRVGEISLALQAGRHTTTHTSWHWIDPAHRGALIDSPGFQEFGLHQIDPAQLSHHLPDFKPLIGQCRFNNCMHHQEPGCAITDAVAAGSISTTRHAIYLDILSELQQRRW